MSANQRGSRRKRFIDKELEERLGGYNKNKLRFAKDFKDNVDSAVRQAGFFPQDLDRVANCVGTSLGKLIANMREARI